MSKRKDAHKEDEGGDIMHIKGAGSSFLQQIRSKNKEKQVVMSGGG